MEFSFQHGMNRGLLGPYYLQMVEFRIRRRAAACFFAEILYAILSTFHAEEKLPSMHVQFFPVYVLTCGAQNSQPSLRFDPEILSSQRHDSPLNECDLYDEFQAAGVSRQLQLQS